MPAFAVGHFTAIDWGPDLADYARRIDATLAPYEGRFRVHGARPQVLEGDWPDSLVLIEFPDMAKARAWYGSEAYRAILPLRTAHVRGAVFLLEGVPEAYEASSLVAKMQAAG